MSDETNSPVRPFEWLTSAQSLLPVLEQLLEDQPRARVLHVGCGSSILGELLAVQDDAVEQVINVDSDEDVLDAMQRRWRSQCQKDGNGKAFDKMKFLSVHLGDEDTRIPLENGSCDVVVDKSTLDCLLCSDRGASSLISEVYRLLRPSGGVYLLISFHHVDLLLPMLENCPGTEWTFSHSVMYRQVEALGAHSSQSSSPTTTDLAQVNLPELHSSAWTPGGFQPDEVYHRTVNVLVGRKHAAANLSTGQWLDANKVYAHVNTCSDRWYQQQNPILTLERTNQIRKDFATPLPMQECYTVVFTVEEREHLSYEAFLEDWVFFLENHPELPRDEMSAETALRFLAEMQ